MAIYNFEDKKQKNKNVDYQKISGIVTVAVSILALFCLITHFVPFIKNFLLGAFGLFCYPFFITSLAIGFALINHKKYIMPKKYGIFLSFSIIFVLCILQLILVQNNGLSFWEYIGKCYNQKTTAGGLVLGFITGPVLYLLNRLGAYIIFIALSIIFIALTVDYIHYLGKNENIKKAVKVINNKQEQNIIKNNITVKELEENIKRNKKEEEPKEKVKLTLDAKVEEESTEETAKRKLGLLASSKQDEEDNSRYFSTDIKKQQIIENPREYILSGNITNEQTVSADERLNKIQANLMEIKNKSSYSSYPIANKAQSHQPVFSGLKQQENSLPNKVLHDDSNPINYSNTFHNKSTMENVVEENKPKYSIIDDDLDNINYSSLQEQGNNVSQEPEVLVAQENKTIKNTLDIEDFSNSILASLKNEKIKDEKIIENNISVANNNLKSQINNTVDYNSPTKLFEEEPVVIEPISPKTPITYVKPSLDLLTTKSVDTSEVCDDIVRKREELEMALDTFGIPAKVIGVVVGPAVTRYELEMPAGISVKKLINLQDDIAYHLSSNGDIRIEAPIPGRRAVGIEVPNEKIATVGLRDIIMSNEFMFAKAPLSIALGKDIAGEIKTFSLMKIPHLLIAGTTGSGKSVCINAIILSLIYKYSPDEVKLILIDPKRVEFSMYNNLPHLLMPNVITDSEKALNALSWCVDEMERRFTVFASAKVKNLEEYNECAEVLEGRAEKVPYIIFIIDELADLLMTAKKDAEDYICRILQKARAAGIHMILATQRPSVDVVTGKIKANLNARICFALMSTPDSKTVLDQGGAEKLLGKGDMLFMSSDTGVPKRIQGCFVTTKEIDDVVTFVKEHNSEYEFDIKTEQSIINPPKNDVISQIDGDRASNDGFDALMPQVLKSVIESGHASISMIQRKFLVGFPRAARIIDQMENAGYISPSDGSKTRSVYITMEEYESLYGE